MGRRGLRFHQILPDLLNHIYLLTRLDLLCPCRQDIQL